MAIVRASDRILLVDQFASGLADARQKVVRVVPGTSPRAVCTGWFIAPTLVVVPGYAVTSKVSHGSGTGFVLQILSADGLMWQELVEEPPELLGFGVLARVPAEPAVGVFRVTSAPSGIERGLNLSFESAKPGDHITLVHYPEGRGEPHLSFGRITAEDATLISYDANTLPGSSGAPVFDAAFRVIAMHSLVDLEHKVNQGLARPAMVDALRPSRYWADIAAHHRIADDAAAQKHLEEVAVAEEPPTEAIHVRAAVSPSLDRASLSPREEALLKDRVADPSAARWTLRAAERRSIITAVGSLEKLRLLRGPSPPRDTAEKVIDDILDGPPYHFAGSDEESLAWWIQACRWFEGVAPQLPAPAQIARELERRRIRSRLARIVGPSFRGRTEELRALNQWFDEPIGPLVLTGVGGIGKSALVARFVSTLPPETLLLWLDFDRADLAPDDAISVLAAIADQAAVQLDGFEKPPLTRDSWEAAAAALGERMKAALPPHDAPLLVLDSFEAAQYAERYQELWPVLEGMSHALSDLRVIVTGRAPVPGLRLDGRPAMSIHLKGLSIEDARVCLREKGIMDPAVLERVLELADGIPLILQLALRYVESGGRVEDLPRDLPPRIVAGFLHARILDRVGNPAFKELATGALVLRRITAEMVEPILGDIQGLTLPPGEPSDWFPDLARELAIVEGDRVLRVRPEVRSATLELLERDRPEFVQTIDERAVRWYESQPLGDVEAVAELVYHRLRRGDVAGAEQAWRDGCGAYLMYAEEEMRDPAARSWLQARLGSGGQDTRPIAAWEQDAAERIRSVRSRGLNRAVDKILDEREDRSDASPLVFHEAFERWSAGATASARQLLAHAGKAQGSVGRDRTALRALLAFEAGDRRAADHMLSHIEDPILWADRPSGDLEALAVQAARVRLAVDLEGEVKLLADLGHDLGPITTVLSSVDVLMPVLKVRLRSSQPSLERSTDRIDLEADLSAVGLLARVEEERLMTLPGEPLAVRRRRADLLTSWSQAAWWTEPKRHDADFGLPDPRHAGVPALAELGWRRWWLLATLPFLQRALALCKSRLAAPSPLGVAIFGTLGLFTLRYGNLRFGDLHRSLGDTIQQSSAAHEALHVRAETWERIHAMLRIGVAPDHRWSQYARGSGDVLVLVDELLRFNGGGYPVSTGPFMLGLVAPDPLQQLVADLAGRADRPT